MITGFRIAARQPNPSIFRACHLQPLDQCPSDHFGPRWQVRLITTPIVYRFYQFARKPKIDRFRILFRRGHEFSPFSILTP